MRQLEKTLASFGLFGRSLAEIELSVVTEATSSDIGEIVPAVDAQKLASNWSMDPMETAYKGDIDELKDKEKYVLRLKTKEWRRIVLREQVGTSKHLFIISSLLFTHPAGMTKEEIRGNLGIQSRDFPKQLSSLIKKDITTFDGSLYRYNFNWQEKPVHKSTPQIHLKPRHSFTREEEDVTTVHRKNEDQPPSNANKKRNRRSTTDAIPQSTIPQHAQRQCKEMLLKCESAISVGELATTLSVPGDELAALLSTLENECKFKTVAGLDGERLILPAKTSIADRKNLVLEQVHKRRAVLLSECKNDFRSILPSIFTKRKEEILTFFEEHDLNVLEVVSKFTSSEALVYCKALLKDSEEFKNAYGLAMVRIGEAFRNKIKGCFFQGPGFAAFDNGFEPNIRKRTKIFYRYMLEQMLEGPGHFIFDKESLLRMRFCSFAACVPVGYENLVPELAAMVFQLIEARKDDSKAHSDKWLEVEKYKNGPNGFPASFSPVSLDSYLQHNETENYEVLYRHCAEFLRNFTLGEVIGLAEPGTQVVQYLQSKCSIKEFVQNFTAIVKCNYFKLFENPEYIFFEFVESSREHFESLCETALKLPPEEPSVPVDLSIRREIFGKIVDFSADEFIQKARDVINNKEAHPSVKAFFLKKLRSYFK